MAEKLSTIDVNAKRRPRRDIRRSEAAIRASSITHILESKQHIKNPLRFIPDVDGFSELSKTEQKRDAKEIERANLFASVSESDSDDELEKAVQISVKPSCSDESNIHKKRKRLMGWASTPSLATSELALLKEGVKSLRQHLTGIDKAESTWINKLETTRQTLAAAFASSKQENILLKEDSRLLLDAFLKVCTTSSTRSRRAIHTKDILDELDDSKAMQDLRIREYERIVGDASSGKTLNRGPIPSISISVQEVDYPWDREAIDGKSSSSSSDESFSIAKILTNIDEAVKLSDLSLSEVEPFFISNSDDQSDSAAAIEDTTTTTSQDTHTTKKSSARNSPMPWNGPQANNSSSKQFSKLISECDWYEYIEEVTKQHNQSSKRKRRATGTISMSSFPLFRTPRGVRLLLSPLSQFEDRYFATIYGGDIESANKVLMKQPVPLPIHIPEEIVAEENLVIERCQLQSIASSADTKVRRLRSAANDWRKISSECIDKANKIKSIHSSLLIEDRNETTRMRRELVAFGIAAPKDGEDVAIAIFPSQDHPTDFIDSKSVKANKASNSNVKSAKKQKNSKGLNSAADN